MNKKEFEIKIFKYIYDENKFTFIGSEQPDIIASMINNPVSIFGVEITEYYINTTHARLKNIPGYYDKIFNKNGFCHKDDAEKLHLNHVTLISPENDEYNVEGMIEYDYRTDYYNSFCETIHKKNDKINKYNSSCLHHNLIIYDQESILNMKDIPILEMNKDSSDSIKNSDFREIFLLTKAKDGILIYIPLKLLLISYELSLLKYYEKHEIFLFKNIKKFNKGLFFYTLLQKKYFSNVYLSYNGVYEILYSRYRIVFEKDKIKISILKESDVNIGDKIIIKDERLNSIIDQYLLLNEKKLLIENKVCFNCTYEKIKE